MDKRVKIGLLLLLLVLAALAAKLLYPSDRTPRGAYYRVVTAVNRGEPEAIFPYLETTAQHAAFTIQRYQSKSLARVRTGYPIEQQNPLVTQLTPIANCEPGPCVFAHYAVRLGWVDQLRRDLSGIRSEEIDGERATIETARGTRYPFRRRDNGMWGLTLFTARLVADAEKAARDYAVIDQAARDYEAVNASERRSAE